MELELPTMATATDSTHAPAVRRPGLLRPAPLPNLSEAFARRGAIDGIEPPYPGPIFTADNPPPFDEWESIYGLRCFGDCCEPDIEDGSSVIMDRQASHTNGDYVAIWQLTKSGLIKALVKRIVFGLPPFVRLPYRHSPQSNCSPIVIVEAPNHRKQYEVDLSMVYAVHRCIGTTAPRPDVPTGTRVPASDIRWFDRPGLSERARRNLKAVGGRVA